MTTDSTPPDGRPQDSDSVHWNLHVGQHIVCVNDRNFGIQMPGPSPIKGVVYTVAAIDGRTFPAVAITLVEIPRIYIDDGKEFEGWFRADRFRPLKKLHVEDFIPAAAKREFQSA